jgi:signal transduction histidine kinase
MRGNPSLPAWRGRIGVKACSGRFLLQRVAATISSMRLLLLDSTPEVEQIAAVLEASGGEFEIAIARSLDDALARLREDATDAVILASSFTGDPAGPIEIVRHCRPGSPPLLLVLDRASELAELDGPMSLAVDDFVVRPLDPIALRTRLRLMRRRHPVVPPSQAILAALPDVMFRLGREGTFVEYHAPDPGELPAQDASIKGRHITEVMPDAVARASMAVVREVLDSNTPGYLEYDLPLPGGARSYEARVVPSGPEHALFIVRDVTERKRKDAQLQAASEIKRAFTSRVISAQEAERQQLSRELHERIGQMLLVHRMDAEWLTRKTEPGPLRDAAEALCSSLDKTLQAVRNLAMDLRPPAIDDLGIGSGLETLVTTIARRSGIRCESEIDPRVASVPADVSVAIYRIAQEALTNAVRHARCERILVSLRHDEGNLELRVMDNGVGFDPSTEQASSWLGLVGMRERAELVGGRVTIESSANQGTCVNVQVPNVNPPQDR